MKSLILVTLTVTLPIFCNAQFSKGDKLIGGSISASSQRTPKSPLDGFESHSNSFSISPRIGFFVNERVTIGATFGFNSSSYRTSSYSSPRYDSRATGVSASLEARRYALLREGIMFSLGGAIAYGTGRSTQTSAEGPVKYNSLSANIYPMFHFFPTQTWGIEGGVGTIGYAYAKQNNIDRSSNSFYLNLGTFNFGISYYFRK